MKELLGEWPRLMCFGVGVSVCLRRRRYYLTSHACLPLWLSHLVCLQKWTLVLCWWNEMRREENASVWLLRRRRR